MNVWGIIRIQALVFIAVLSLFQGCGYEERLKIEELIPTEEEMTGWTLAVPPIIVSDENELYLHLNGAADEFIQRGWVKSVITAYERNLITMRIVIHDMGDDGNSIDIFNYERPISYVVLWEEKDTSALLDTGLPNSYEIMMRRKRFYIELGIDNKGQQSEQLITECAELIRDKR